MNHVRSTETRAVIVTNALTRTFTRGKERVEAVKGIDVRVHDGELVAFLGPNGAGKSTTLRMLTGLLSPTSGTAEVAGIDVATHPQRVRRRIGYIGQGNSAGHSHQVRDEIVAQGRFYGLTRGQTTRRATELFDALQLTGLERRVVSSLSGGQRRRLDVAMGLLTHPPLLFLDEPSTGMDPQARANLWAHITGLRERLGMTIVLTTHYLEEAERMAERVVIIDHGSIVADDSPQALRLAHANDVVRLRWDDAHDAGRAHERLSGAREWAPHLGDSGVADGGLLLELNRGSDRLPTLLHELDSAGLRPDGASIHEASLDDVFLTLTGRSLREEGAAA